MKKRPHFLANMWDGANGYVNAEFRDGCLESRLEDPETLHEGDIGRQFSFSVDNVTGHVCTLRDFKYWPWPCEGDMFAVVVFRGDPQLREYAVEISGLWRLDGEDD